MNILKWFRRRRPAAPPAINTKDVLIAYYWAYTMTEWDRLSDARRAYCRANVTQADRFVS